MFTTCHVPCVKYIWVNFFTYAALSQILYCPKVCTLGQKFSLKACLCKYIDISEFWHLLPFWNFYILNHSIVVKFWAIQEFIYSGHFQKFYILNQSIISTFWTIPEFLLSGPFKNCKLLDHSRILTCPISGGVRGLPMVTQGGKIHLSGHEH